MQNPNSQKFDLFLDEPIKQKEEIKINTLAFHATRPNSRGRVDCRWGIQVPLDVIFSPANNFNIQQMQFAFFFFPFFLNKKNYHPSLKLSHILYNFSVCKLLMNLQFQIQQEDNSLQAKLFIFN